MFIIIRPRCLATGPAPPLSSSEARFELILLGKALERLDPKTYDPPS
jgi:hypothetical protein